jgi:hypothetical protein
MVRDDPTSVAPGETKCVEAVCNDELEVSVGETGMDWDGGLRVRNSSVILGTGDLVRVRL